MVVKQHMSVPATDSTVEEYSGRIAMFGEDILGYLPVDKGGPRWRQGVWLGKVHCGDMHVVGTSDGVFLTRSIRPHAVAFNLGRFALLENYPWEFGLAALGNKLVHNQRLTHPLACCVGASLLPNIDVEAIQVQQYAIALFFIWDNRPQTAKNKESQMRNQLRQKSMSQQRPHQVTIHILQLPLLLAPGGHMQMAIWHG